LQITSFIQICKKERIGLADSPHDIMKMQIA